MSPQYLDNVFWVSKWQLGKTLPNTFTGIYPKKNAQVFANE
jgi:hypothetical protein